MNAEPFTHTHDGSTHEHAGDPFKGTKDFKFRVWQKGSIGEDDATPHFDLVAAKSLAEARREMQRRVDAGILARFEAVKAK